MCLLYAGVHFLLDHSTPALRKSLPFKDWSNVDYKELGSRGYYVKDGKWSGYTKYRNNPRVFCFENKIYKFYDTEKVHLNVNLDLTKENNEPYLLDIEVVKQRYASRHGRLCRAAQEAVTSHRQEDKECNFHTYVALR